MPNREKDCSRRYGKWQCFTDKLGQRIDRTAREAEALDSAEATCRDVSDRKKLGLVDQLRPVRRMRDPAPQTFVTIIASFPEDGYGPDFRITLIIPAC